jgi:hypothetical protein
MSVAEFGERGRGGTERTGHEHRVPGPRTAAEDRSGLSAVAEHRD